MQKSISNAESPPGLSPVMQIEFNILKSKFTELESQWFQLLNNSNSDQVRYGDIVRNEYDSMISQTRELARLQSDSVDAQYAVKKAKIDSDYEENKKLLFKRIIRGYYLRYQKITSRLRELMGKDFDIYIKNNDIEIDFPQIPTGQHTERNIPQPDEIKLALTPHEVEKQYQQLKKIIEKSKVTTDDDESSIATQINDQ